MKQFDKLKAKLAELFQLDQADLDFGIYRIMNARRDEIIQFLDRDLLPQVTEAFSQYTPSDKAEIQKQLDEAIQQGETLGADPDTLPKVKELRTRLADDAVDLTALENEVYSRLYDFFNRYYDEGDFLSLRRYKKGVYAIPYEGEEVKLHWANSDQYYIKTTENFRDYAFKTTDGHRVHFKIVEADTEKDNIKAANDNDRRFILHGETPVTEEDGELVIRFEYRPDGEKRKQDAITKEAALDGIYVIRTSETAKNLSAENAVRGYKRLADVEQAFRSLKGLDLLVRPIHHRVDNRVKTHIFACMLAYYVVWHLKQAWTPLLFADEHLAEHRAERDPVASARPAAEVTAKKAARQTEGGYEVQSFSTLLAELGTQCRNLCEFGEGKSVIHITKITEPTPLQSEAFRLLKPQRSQ